MPARDRHCEIPRRARVAPETSWQPCYACAWSRRRAEKAIAAYRRTIDLAWSTSKAANRDDGRQIVTEEAAGSSLRSDDRDPTSRA